MSQANVPEPNGPRLICRSSSWLILASTLSDTNTREIFFVFFIDRDPNWCCFNDVLMMTDPVGGNYAQHER